jgi:hypothetical protein
MSVGAALARRAAIAVTLMGALAALTGYAGTARAAPNAPPVATPQDFVGAEDEPLRGTLVARDPEGGALTMRVRTKPKHGALVIDKDTGAFTFTPAKDFHGDDAFTFYVSDGRLKSTGTVAIHVTAVDDVPVARSLSLTTTEDQGARGTLVATDVEGDALTYAIDPTRLPVHGAATVDPTDARVTYAPAPDYYGEDSFAVVISAGTAQVRSHVSVTVAPVNDAPRAPPVSLVVDEDSAVSAIAATDVDGDALTFTLASQPKNGAVLVDKTSGALTYQPHKDFFGDDELAVDVTDGRARSTVSVSVRITPVEDAPVALPLALATVEDARATGKITALDMDGDALAYALDRVRAPAHGAVTVDPTTGALTYTPVRDFFGDDAFGVEVSARRARVTANVSVKVAAVNDAPSTTSIELTVEEDGAVTGALLATDVDGDVLSFRVVESARRGTLTVDDRSGAIAFKPARDFHGADAFVFEVSDGRLKSTATAALRITPVDDAPVPRPLSIATIEDTPATGTITALDVDGDALAYALDRTRAPAHGTASVDPTTGAVAYAPARDFGGVDTFGVDVSARGAHATAAVSVKITPTNDAPVAQALELAVDEDGALEGTAAATDVDGDVLAFRVATVPKRGRVTLHEKSGAFTYRPDANFFGDDAFTFDASDGLAKSTATATLRVSAVNDAPVAHPLALRTKEDIPVTARVAVLDVDNDRLSFRVQHLPAHGDVAIDMASGAFTFTPSADFNGNDAFTIEISDGNASAAADVGVQMVPVPDVPRVRAGVVLETREDTPASGRLPASDADGDPIIFKITSTPRLGTAYVEDKGTGAWRFTPKANVSGRDDISFEVSGGGIHARGVVSINIVAANDAPVLPPFEMSSREDTPVEGILAGTDIDGDALRYALAVPPGRGRVTIAGAVVRYEPARDDNGDVTFSVVASDGALTSAPALVTVHISPVNDAPALIDQGLTTLEDIPHDGKIAAIDVDHDPMSFRVRRAPTRGRLDIIDASLGTFRFVPDRNLAGPDGFTVEVTDAAGAVAVGRVGIDVVAVDDPPVARAGEVFAPRSGRFTGRLTGYDPEATALTYRIHTPPQFGAVQITNERTGEYLLVTDGVAGNTFFLFTVSDGKLTSAPAKIDISTRR